MTQYLKDSLASTSAGRLARRAVVVVAALAVPQLSANAQRVLRVVASDTSLDASATVAAGLTTVALILKGQARRDLVVHRVPAGTEPEVLARKAAGRPVTWFERWSFGGPAAPADSVVDSRVTMELRPGRYVLVSYQLDSAGRPIGDRYMWRSLNAVATSVLIPARFGVADLTVRMKDARIELAGTVRPGQRAIQVENAGGRPHEVLIARLKPGKTVEDVKRWKRNERDEAPFVYLGGLTPMSSGMTAQTRLVFQAGAHVVLCPMRHDHTRAHDHERGVLATFTVG